MTDDVRERGCEQYGDELAELALGVLTGRDRARLLSHVESCPRCAEELEILSRTADSVVQAAPEMEPPLGFEVRLFERMGLTDVTPRRRRSGRGGRSGSSHDRRSGQATRSRVLESSILGAIAGIVLP